MGYGYGYGYKQKVYHLVFTNSLLLTMAVEIVDLPEFTH